MINIYRDAEGYFLQNSRRAVRAVDFSLDELFRSENPSDYALDAHSRGDIFEGFESEQAWLAPIANQEVWAAGVTYYRSRSARMEESESSGGDRFYDLVYEAERPELFFKSTGPRCRGHLAGVCIRSDSDWNVPEPELTLALNRHGKIFGYTIGNDMSSRSIEGENPLYLPQAKIYRGSCAIGPCLTVAASAVNDKSKIKISISRRGDIVFAGETDVSQIKRSFEELAEFLFRDNEFFNGAFLMTGTGVVPESDFSLKSGDVIAIEIDGLGRLCNFVE